MTLGALVNETLQLLWPARCAACDRTTADGTIFCFECTPSLSALIGACPGCALPRHDWNASPPPRGGQAAASPDAQTLRWLP